MADRIDISEPLQELCRRLGLEYGNVAEIIFRPDTVSAEVYLNNDKGEKYMTSNGPAATQLLFDVRT